MRLHFKNWLKASLMALFLLPNIVLSQDFTIEDFKVALVGQFIKNIEWPGESEHADFTIVVPQDQAMMDTLSVLHGETINNHTIIVKFSESLGITPDANLVYISDKVVGEIDNALALMRGNNTLVVTENSPTLHNIMINIVENVASQGERLKLQFQINRPNIVFEGLEINPDLILHGGSELDVASLYRETEQAMQALRSENLQAFNELEAKRSELTIQQRALLEMESNLAQAQRELNERNQVLEKQQQQLLESTRKLNKVNEDYLSAREESKLQLAQAESNVQEQLNILQDLEGQITAKNALITQKDKTLQQQTLTIENTSERLQEKTDEVAQQAEVIDKQFAIIIGTIATLFVFTISTAIISKIFLKNRRITRELESTLETLDNAQQQLIESEKLASMGQMVAGVAHEINTPIGVVVTSSSTIGMQANECLKKLENKTLRKNDMERFLNNLVDTDQLIQSNLERCASLINNFKQVAADQVVAENRNILLRDYINEIMGTLSIVMRKNDVEWKVEGDNPQHHLDPGLLSQVINNLVTNAINHAFPDEKKKSITITVTEKNAFNHIDFVDNGIGMEEETRKKIFDPFFTTKRGEGGTGLGMNIVYNLITSKLHGSISVESSPGSGTKFAINLPRLT